MKEDLDVTEVSTRDLVRGLRACSQFLQNDQIGNPAMAIAFRSLAQAMQPLANRPLKEVLANIQKLPRFTSPLADLNLQNLAFEEIEELLASSQLSKKEIVRIGHERLGLTEGRLRREPINIAIESIRTTMRNQDSMGMMEEESRRVALQRTT